MSEEQQRFTVTEQDEGERLDVLLVRLTGESRNQVRRQIEAKAVRVDNDIVTRAAQRAKAGQAINWTPPEVQDWQVVPQEIPLDVRYEDSDLIVVNKPAGMVVHPAVGNPDGTLVNALLHHCSDLQGIGGVLRPGIVHRIDKDTSGLLVVAKNERAHQVLAQQFAEHSIERSYRAICFGAPKTDEGTIEGNLGRHPNDRKRFAVVERGGKHAVTHYRVVTRYDTLAELQLKLETGRTHQIRVHLAHIGHPVVGDPVYARSRRVSQLSDKPLRDRLAGITRQLLHAASLGFVHPSSGQRMHFEAELAEDIESLLQWLKTRGKSST